MSVLVVCAHPDDEVFGCGGTLLTLKDVHILFLTDGVSSRTGHTPKDMHNRVALADRVAGETGWKMTHIVGMWGYDNRLDSLPLLRVVKEVEDVIDEIKPTTIFTHYEHDLNVDHRVAYQATVTACRSFKYPYVKQIYSFEVPSSTELASVPFKPDTFVNIEDTLYKKMELFDMYDETNNSRNKPVIDALAWYRGTQGGCRYAEAFKTVRRIMNVP